MSIPGQRDIVSEILRSLLLVLLTVATVAAYTALDGDAEKKQRDDAGRYYRGRAGLGENDLLNGYLRHREYLGTEQRQELLDRLQQTLGSGMSQMLIYESAALEFDRGHYGQAVQLFREIRSDAYDLRERSMYSRARAFRMLGMLDSADVWYKRTAENFPDSPLADDALFWLAHTQESHILSISGFRTLVDGHRGGDHWQGALIRLIRLQIETGDLDGALMMINRHAAELPHRFEKERAIHLLRSNRLQEAEELLSRERNTWPGRFELARLYIEKMIYIGAGRKDVLKAYRDCISPAAGDVANFRAYLDRGDIYLGMEAFSFVEPRKSLCYPDTLRSLDEYFELPYVIGDAPELIFSYEEARRLPGTDFQKGHLINAAGALLLDQGLYHGYRVYSDKRELRDDRQALQGNKLHFRYLSAMDMEYSHRMLQAEASRGGSNYLAESLLGIIGRRPAETEANRRDLQMITEKFPDSPARYSAALLLMRMAFYLDRDMGRTAEIFEMVHRSRDIPPNEEMADLYLRSLAISGKYDHAVSVLSFYALLDVPFCQSSFRLLEQIALCQQKQEAAAQLREFIYESCRDH